MPKQEAPATLESRSHGDPTAFLKNIVKRRGERKTIASSAVDWHHDEIAYNATERREQTLSFGVLVRAQWCRRTVTIAAS